MHFHLPNHLRSLICEYGTDPLSMKSILTIDNDKITVGLANRIHDNLTCSVDWRILTDLLLVFEYQEILENLKGHPETNEVLGEAEEDDNRFYHDDYDPAMPCDETEFSLMLLKKSEIHRTDVQGAIKRMRASGTVIDILVVWIARGVISVSDPNCEYVAILKNFLLNWSLSSKHDPVVWLYFTRDAPLDVFMWTYETQKSSWKYYGRNIEPNFYALLRGALPYAVLRCDVEAVTAILHELENAKCMFHIRFEYDILTPPSIDAHIGAGSSASHVETGIWDALSILFWVDHPKVHDVIDVWLKYISKENCPPKKPLTYYVPPNLVGHPHRHWRIPPGVEFTPLCEFKLDHLKWWVAQGDLLPQPPLHVMGIFAYRLDSPLEIREWCFNEYQPITSSLYALHYRNEDVIRDYVGEPMRTLVFNATEPSIDSDVALDHFKMMFNKSSVFYEMSIHVAVQDWKFPTLLKQNPIAVECRKWFYANVTTRPSAEDKDNEVTSAGDLLKEVAKLRETLLMKSCIDGLPEVVFKRAAQRIRIVDIMLQNRFYPDPKFWTYGLPKGTWSLDAIKLMARTAGYVPRGAGPQQVHLKYVPEWCGKPHPQPTPGVLLNSYNDFVLCTDGGVEIAVFNSNDAREFLNFFFRTVDINEYIEVVRAEEPSHRMSLLFMLMFHPGNLDVGQFTFRAGRDLHVPLFVNPDIVLDVVKHIPDCIPLLSESYTALERYLRFPPAGAALEFLKGYPDFDAEFQMWEEMDEIFHQRIREDRDASRRFS